MGHRQVKRTELGLLFCIAVSIASPGCYAETYAVAPEPVLVATPPPEAVIYMEEGVCPAGYAWIYDYWHWNGTAWVLISGGCTYRPGYIWVGPTYIHVEGGMRYVRGYWKPAPAYHHVKGSPKYGKQAYPSHGAKGRPPQSKTGYPPRKIKGTPK